MAAGSATLPPGDYGPGVVTLGPANVGGSLSEASVSFDISQHLDPAILWDVSIDISLDNGQTWQVMGGFSRPGGPVTTGPDGKPASAVTMSIKHPPGGGRRIRCVMTFTGGSVRTSGSIAWQ
jgi:hypothetical protein